MAEEDESMDDLLFEDSIDVAGFAPLEEQDGLLGRIMKISDPRKRKRAMKKIFQKQVIAGTLLNSRDQAMARVGGLPKDIRGQLLSKRAQFVDASWYWLRAAGAGTDVRIIQTDDNKGVGVTNVAQSKLEKSQYFLVDTIVVMSGVNAVITNTVFDIIPATIANGDFDFQANGNKFLTPKDTSTEVFRQPNRQDTMRGAWKMANPKWIAPETDIQFNMRFPLALAPNTNIKLLLNGTGIIQY